MTYEYICQACEHEWEAQQRISEDPLKDCPSCGEAEAKRQISTGGGFILKGGGWYSDLYSSTSNKPKTEGEGSKAESTKDAQPTQAEPTQSEKADSSKTDTKASSASNSATPASA